MKANHEYQTCVAIAMYIKCQYPTVLFRFDLAGLNLSKAQAGMNKAIQCMRGYPDLFIMEPRGENAGLFLEIKAEGTRIYKAGKFHVQCGGEMATDHLAEQAETLNKLRAKGYACYFAVGFDDARYRIDQYLKN